MKSRKAVFSRQQVVIANGRYQPPFSIRWQTEEQEYAADAADLKRHRLISSSQQTAVAIADSRYQLAFSIRKHTQEQQYALSRQQT